MPDYQLGKIYKIISPNTEKIYIGSTVQKTLACRMRAHRNDYRKWKNEKYRYVSSFAMIEFGNESMILLELFPCNSKDELRAREQYHIGLNAGICVNRIKSYQPPGGSRERTNERAREKFNCECGGRFITAHKTIHYKTQMHQNFLKLNDNNEA